MKQLNLFSEAVEARFSTCEYDRSPAALYAIIEYTLNDGGKRMRPLLCLLGASLFEASSERVIAGAIDAAIAVEVFHNFTLLHDDIMDSAPTRRGRPTAHTKWGANNALLSGDAMMILSYDVLAKAAKFTELFPVFNRAAIEVCEGQQFDMEFESVPCVELKDYIEMIRLKTASLMAAATKMGAVSMGASSEECEQLYRYGENLGLAFQIQDDLLDSYGNSATFGKKIGGDISEGKQTFLRITAIGRANDAERKVLESSRSFEQVIAIYNTLDVATAAKEAINHYFALADECLDGFDSDRAAPLREYSNYLLHRNR